MGIRSYFAEITSCNGRGRLACNFLVALTLDNVELRRRWLSRDPSFRRRVGHLERPISPKSGENPQFTHFTTMSPKPRDMSAESRNFEWQRRVEAAGHESV